MKEEQYMKNLIFLILALFFLKIAAISQPCLPEGISFTTQQHIDNFQINYPNCTEIEGYLSIQGDNITNLNGLGVLTSIGGDLSIMDNDVLFNLTGLNNLTTIDGGLFIGDINIQGNFGNPSLTSLDGLENLISIGGSLEIKDNNLLTSIAALYNLTSVNGFLVIGANEALSNLSGLNNVAVIGGGLAIYANANLISLTGLTNLVSIGGYLAIYSNDALISLIGLDNIDAASIVELEIQFNQLLSVCEVQSICDFLTSSSGTIDIEGNAQGCNTPEEVIEACWTSVDEINSNTDLAVFPNPFKNKTTIEFNLMEPGFVKLSVIDYTGTEIQKLISKQIPAGIHQFEWNTEGLPSGIYFLRLETNGISETRKLIFLNREA